ncbi:MAG: NosD domain-containing protein [Candidatus Bathyarchaeia archaeon]
MEKNMSKTLLLLILCLCTTTIIKYGKTLVNAKPSTLIVPYDFGSIQDAINNANSGDVILIHPGIYYENIIINKSITLLGKDRENTIIDGRGLGSIIISIQASNVNISNLTIQNSSPSIGCGIYVGRLAESTTVSNNNVRNNNIGIQMEYSNRNQICENMISTNNVGILLLDSSGNTIFRNNVKDNHDGIDMYYSIGNVVYENLFSGNDWGVFLFYSSNNIFYHNNFVNNNYDVYAKQTINTWSVNGEGNYWDDYACIDEYHGPYQNTTGSDGIGDSPYKVAEGNVDYYPLMGMFYKFIASFSGNIYHVAIISNSTILNFTFKTIAETKARVILLNVSSNGNSASFSRIVIPKTLMAHIHAVLVDEEEVNATLLDVENAENLCLYIEHPCDCSIKLLYSEILDLYYQLLQNYEELLKKYDYLDASYSTLLDRYYQLLSNHTALLDMYRSLNGSYSMLLELNLRLLVFNASVNVLIEKFNALNRTLYNLLGNYSQLQDEFNDANSSFKSQEQNLKSLIYIFAATTTTFILTTIYFSKKAHEKAARSRVASDI